MFRDLKATQKSVKLLVLMLAMTSLAHNASAEDNSRKPTIIFQSNRSEQDSIDKREYYSSKIRANEVSFLKEELEKQKQKHEKELAELKAKFKGMLKKQKVAFQKIIEESSYPVIEALEKKLRIVEQDLVEQKKVNEQALIQKELEFNMKVKTLSDQFDRVVEEAKQSGKYIQPGNDTQKVKELKTKVGSLQEKLKIKDNHHEEALKRKEKEYEDRLKILSDGSKNAQEMEREQEIGDAVIVIDQKDSQIRVLQQRIKDVNEKIERQRKVYDKELEIKEKEYKQKHEELEEKYRLRAEEEVKGLEGKLNEKYAKLDEIIRSKERTHAEEIFKKEQELEKIKKEAEEKEKTLRQLIADKELAYGQSIEKEKNKYVEENEALKKSSQQLRLYILKLKEEVQTKSVIVSEKNDQIQILNKKLALYSGEETSEAYKISRVVRDELENVKKENKRQGGEIKELKDKLSDQKSVFETRLAKQKKTIMNLQRDAEAEILHNSFEWEKKLRIQEAKYIKQIRMLEKENKRLQSEYELKIEKVSKRLRDKIDKDEKIRKKLSGVHENQMDMLEEMLLSKAKMMQKASPDFKKEQKDKAETYFKRAMSAILKKNYARAKYELEEVLLVEPDNQRTINMLGSINFLIEKK